MLLSTPDWRWLAYRDDNPWYPTAGLSRQDVIGILNIEQCGRARSCCASRICSRPVVKHAARL
jgi:hypothetical protein